MIIDLKKIEFICDFCNTKSKIINGNIRNIEHTNLSYIEPHRVIIKEITFLAFNYSKILYINNLSNFIEIKDLESKIRDCDICNELKFTPEDILIKRDLDYINQIVYPEEYEENTYMWKDYTREEKSDLIMRYVDNVELTLCGKNKVKIGEVFFRESMCKPCNDLYDAEFLAKKDYAILGNVGMKLRFSEYLPIEKVSEIIFTLRQYYNVGYFEATYYYDNKVMFFNDYQNRNIVRIFPIEDYKKKDKLDTLELGVIYIGNNEKCLIDNKEDLFNTIPERTNCITYELDEDIKKRKQEIEKEIKEFREKIMNK